MTDATEDTTSADASDELPVEVPQAEPEKWMQPSDAVGEVRAFTFGGTQLCSEVKNKTQDGYVFFINGYPLYLPRNISEEMANFILDK